MLIKRFVVALIAIPTVFIILYGGQAAFLALIAVVASLTFIEANRLVHRMPVSSIARFLATTLAVAYVGLPFACMYMIYNFKSGPVLVVYTLIAVWTADTSAYIVGSRLGKRRLAPKISPNKTVEGAVGSLTVTAALFAVLTSMPSLSIQDRVLFGGLIAVAALGGDLFESRLKRLANVKDSGAILPGHGGILDRVDSLLAAAPVSYLLLRLFI